MKLSYRKKQEINGILLCLASGLCWGLAGVFNKVLLNTGESAISIIFYRNVAAFLCIALMTFFANRTFFKVKKSDIPRMMLVCLFMFFMSFGYFFASKYIDVSIAVIILYTYPSMVAILSVFIYREPLTFRLIAVLIITMLGLCLSVSLFTGVREGVNAIGLLFGFLAAVGGVGYTVTVKKLTASYHPLTVNFYGFAFSVLGYGLFYFLLHGEPLSLGVMLGSFGNCIPFMIGFICSTAGVMLLRPRIASILGTSETVFSILFAGIILGEVITFGQIAGISLIIFGIVLLQINIGKKQPEKDMIP